MRVGIFLVTSLADWYSGWLTDILAGWLIDWHSDLLASWLIDWLTDYFIKFKQYLKRGKRIFAVMKAMETIVEESRVYSTHLPKSNDGSSHCYLHWMEGHRRATCRQSHQETRCHNGNRNSLLTPLGQYSMQIQPPVSTSNKIK